LLSYLLIDKEILPLLMEQTLGYLQNHR